MEVRVASVHNAAVGMPRAPRSDRMSPWAAWLFVLGTAALARLAFAAITRDTYDYDEFVLLLLARDYAHGAIPYHTFEFFHPPLILALLRAATPLTNVWWPSGRLMAIGIDVGNVALLFAVARRIFAPRTAMAAAIVYALNPVALVAGTRVGQDPLLTLFGLAGLLALLRLPGKRGAVVAGACLALACWTKYPALVLLPAYLFAARRRFGLVAASFVAAMALLAAAYLPQLHELYQQTVVFQRGRWSMSVPTRLQTEGLFWIAVNPLALPALVLRRPPLWVAAGYAVGLPFALNSQVYYHYFVPIAPFAALLTAPLLAGLSVRALRALGIAAAIACAGFGALLAHGGPAPLLVTAAHLSDVSPTVRLIDATTARTGPVLADRYEYAYLANRPAFDHYFWNLGVLKSAGDLETRLSGARLAILSYGASSGYPSGFVFYLNRHFRHVRTHANTVWLVSGSFDKLPGNGG